MTDDLDLKPSDLQVLSSREGVASFFSALGYRVDGRVPQTVQALGITAETLQRQIRHIERIADHENGALQVYLVEFDSVTVAGTQGLARAFRNRAGNYLLVLTDDYEELDFVLLERTLPVFVEGAIAPRQVGIRPRLLNVNRRNPGLVELRVLRRFTCTESDAEGQFEKLRSAYTVAEWAEPFFNNRALFSDYYLNERLRRLPAWSEDPKPAYKRLRELYVGARERFSGREEGVPRKELLEPTFEALGFTFRSGKASTSAASEPDYRLYEASRAAEKKAPLAVCLAYAWGRYLDGKDEARDLETPEENPGAAVVSTLEAGEAGWAVVTNGKLWRLYSAKAHSRATNYYEIDLDETLASGDPNEAFRYFWLLFRAAAFVPEAELRRGETVQLSFVQKVLEDSEAFAKRLGDRLKERVFEEIFPHFAEGFVESMGGSTRLLALPGEQRHAELSRCFEGTLTFLYRLLFLLYAEARNLLPVRETRGYWEISLRRLTGEVAGAAGTIEDQAPESIRKTYRADSTGLHDRISALCRVVDLGNRELNVPFYNGGLFLTEAPSGDHTNEAENARFLASHKIPDRFLALGLDRMARDVDEKRGDLVFIDYKSLGVRQLGSIYEGLLEFKLRIASEKMALVKGKKTEEVVPYAEVKKRGLAIVLKGRGREAEERTYRRGEVYLENDRRERKATGSYYTPDHIVKYIVEHAAGPVLEEKFEALRSKLREAQKALAREREKAAALRKTLGRGDDPERETYLKHRPLVEEFFNARVLDPAMGSGHFLVEAVDFITDRMLRFLNGFPWNPVQYELAETRRTILEEMERQGVVIDAARLTDVNLLKRQVLKRCVYGVDLNPMAVELAKVSLWLDCFTLGAPLSFVDHHLKCGNSLIGVTVEEARTTIEQAGQFLLFGSWFAGRMLAIDLMRRVGELPDVTAEQVRESRSEFEKANEALAPFKRVLNVYTSQWFGNGGEKRKRGKGAPAEDTPAVALLKWQEAEAFANARDEEGLKRVLGAMPAGMPRVAERALAAAAEKRFFHWELEFPEVFYGPRPGTTQAIERLEGAGFDAVVGNPPYDELSQHALGRELPEACFFDAQPTFSLAGGGRLNWYHFFVLRSVALLRPRGCHGFIVPMSLLGDQFTRTIRTSLLRSHQLLRIEAFPQKDDAENRVFPDAKLPTCVYVLRRSEPSETFFVRVHPGRYIQPTSPSYEGDLSTLLSLSAESLEIPLVPKTGWDMLRRLASSGTIGKLREFGASPTSGEIVFNAAFRPYLTTDSRETLILRGSHIQRWEVIDEAKQGEPMYLKAASFLRNARTGSKAFHFKMARVVYQECAAIDNWRRVIAAYLPAGYFCGHKICYFTDYKCSPMTLLAVFSSKLINWFVTALSTNNSLPAYLVGALPFPKFAGTTGSRKCKRRTAELMSAYGVGAELIGQTPGDPAQGLKTEGFGEVLSQVRSLEAEPHALFEVLHDLLACLGETMVVSQKEKQDEVKRFLGWLDGMLAGGSELHGGRPLEVLNGKSLIKGYLGDYQKGECAASFEAIWEILLKNKGRVGRRLDGEFRARLQHEQERSLRVLVPIKWRLAATDWLIDQLVYGLYGLTEGEIGLVESSVAGTRITSES
ncbi:MAG: Eco57I restriction-modification methylase domain-containing protein [Planctomycetota bacterium]